MIKNSYLTFACAFVMLLWSGGCTEEDDIIHSTSEHPMVFITEVTTDGGARGTLINDFPIDAQVGLFGYCCDENGDYGSFDWEGKKTHCLPDENLFNDTPMTNSGRGIWNYGTLKYWYDEADYKYTFFAYYPYKGTGIEVETSTLLNREPIPLSDGNPILKYTMPFNNRNNITTELNQDDVLDVLYAGRIDWQNTNNQPVPLTFAHLMTGLEFEVDNYADADVTISELKLQGTFHRTAAVTLNEASVANNGNYRDNISISDTYSGYFPIISASTTYDNRSNPHKVNDASNNLVELMLLADYANHTIGSNVELQISYIIGTGLHQEETLQLPADMIFYPGVKNILRLEFLGDHLMLSFIPGSTWTLGGDDEIIFE